MPSISDMSRAAVSVAAYGLYAVFAGAGFLFFSNDILTLFGFEERADHWILVVAVLTLGLGYYYLSSALAESRHFFEISWKGRLWFVVAMTALATAGEAPWNILLVASVDLTSAIWTALALRHDDAG